MTNVMLPMFLVLLVLCVTAFVILVSELTNDMLIGANNGQHRKSAAEIYGCSDNGSDQGAGGAAPFGSGIATPIGTGAGAIAALAAAGTHSQRLMAHHAMSPPAYLGSAGHSAAQMMQLAHIQQQQQLAQMAHPLLMPGNTLVVMAGGASPPHPKTFLKSEGVRAGEIIAWRAWIVLGDNLRSATASTVWNPTEPMQGDAAGGFGIHAYKNPHGPMMDGYADTEQQGAWVIGEVALWGDVIEHERGYRAEYGRVHSLVTWSRAVDPYARERIQNKYLAKPTGVASE